ncbi:MAG: 4Fe-4S ferredoxin, partial [Thermoprotei archaeon]
MYKYPRLIDVNAKSKIFRNKEKLLIIGRCLEIEH